MHPLQDKVVLITGASSGIGRAAAVQLAQRGAHLCLAARRRDELEQVADLVRACGRKAIVIPTDVTDPEQCRLLVEQTLHQLGQLDVLLCSAGVSMRARFADCDLAAMEQVVRVNFFGTLNITHHALPFIRASRGSLVAISSLAGKRGLPTYAAYSAGKFAVQGLYESLRVELAAEGVHVGVLSPGHVDTPLRERVLGPDGKPWASPPPAPFKVWPVEPVVDRLIDLIVHRRSEILVPRIAWRILLLEHLVGSWLGDWWLGRRFHAADLPGHDGLQA